MGIGSVNKIASSPLQLTVYHASEKSFGVTSVLVSGKVDAVLIDAQFTLSEANELLETIKSNGKKLTAIYVSHSDPDYYFGLEVFKRAFPEVTVYASPMTVENIKKTAQKKLDVWGPQLGANGTKNIVLPQELKGTAIDLEDQKLEIIGLDGESPSRTFVWIPSIKAVVGGVNIFGKLHLWTADAASPDARKKWMNILNAIEVLNPSIVVPGHFKEGTPFDSSTISYSMEYLKYYEEVLLSAKNSKTVIETMQKKYSESGLLISLEIGAKVNKGEMKW